MIPLYPIILIILFLVQQQQCSQQNQIVLEDKKFLSKTKNQNKSFRIPLKKISQTCDDKKKLLEFITYSQQYSQDPDNFLQGNNSDSQQNSDNFSLNFIQQKQQGKNAVRLYNFQNDQFVGDVSFYDPDNTFEMIFDTGSSNLWINSKRCNDVGCKNHKQYDLEQSYTYQKVGLNLDVGFGTGSLNGVISEDTLYFSGIQVNHQQFAEIENESGGVFEASKFDGIVGMGFPSMSAYDIDPLFDSIMKEHALEKNIFSFYMDSQEGQKNSQLIIGDTDPSLYEGQINYHKISKQNFWQFKADNILLNGEDVGFCKNGCDLIADTGTSLLTVPSDNLDDIVDKIQVEDTCYGLDKLPKMQFIVDGIEYELSGEDYVVTTIDENSQNFSYSSEEKAAMLEMGQNVEEQKVTKDCALGFIPLDLPNQQRSTWILGNLFLKKYYSVYDRDNNQIGLAKAKQQTQNSQHYY